MAFRDTIQSVIIRDANSTNVKNMISTTESKLDDTLKLGQNSKAMTMRVKTFKDSYGNSLTGAGDFDVQRSFTNYGFSNDTMNWSLWLVLYNDSWVFKRAIDKPAQDMVNSGFTIVGEQDYSKVYRAFNKHKNKLIELLMWGALFGGSVAVMMFDGISDEDLCKPINKERIKGKTFKLYVSDRWYGVGVSNETVSNMKDIDFGKPMMYNITFADGRSVNVHHSYVLRYEHRTAPNLIKNGQLQGWGYAEGAHILNELSRDDQLKSAITTLVNKSLIEVIKMAGMRGIFMGTDQGNEEQLTKRLEMVNWGRSYNSLTFLDKDDEYTQNTFGGLAGLSDILQQNMWLISAALEMQGVLYGDLRGGFSQAADDMDRYSTTIKNRCEALYRPVLNKFLKILFIVYDIKGNLDFEFNDYNQTEKNNKKVEAADKYTDFLSKWNDKGIISKYQMAKSLKDYIEKNRINIQISDAQLNRLKLEEEKELLTAYKELGKSEEYNNKGNMSSEESDLDSELGLDESTFSSGMENSGGTEELPDLPMTEETGEEQ